MADIEPCIDAAGEDKAAASDGLWAKRRLAERGECPCRGRPSGRPRATYRRQAMSRRRSRIARDCRQMRRARRPRIRSAVLHQKQGLALDDLPGRGARRSDRLRHVPYGVGRLLGEVGTSRWTRCFRWNAVPRIVRQLARREDEVACLHRLNFLGQGAGRVGDCRLGLQATIFGKGNDGYLYPRARNQQSHRPDGGPGGGRTKVLVPDAIETEEVRAVEDEHMGLGDKVQPTPRGSCSVRAMEKRGCSPFGVRSRS